MLYDFFFYYNKIIYINNGKRSRVIIQLSSRQYVLTDIMKKRKRDQAAIESKIKNKIALKGKRKKNQDALKAPEKFIKQYQAQQKSYAHYKLKVFIMRFRIEKIHNSESKDLKDQSMVQENCC